MAVETIAIVEMTSFEVDLAAIINKYNGESASNTPDMILAQYLKGCLAVFDTAVQQRETWYNRDARPGQVDNFVEPAKVTINCPFCSAVGFNKVGLNIHLSQRRCSGYDTDPILCETKQEEKAAHQKKAG